MRLVTTLRLRLRSLFRGSRVERELDAELRDHLERQVELHVAAGLSRADARAAAHREFGSVALVQEQCRDMRRVGWLEDLARDAAYAVRSMRRAPVHTAVTALSLAVGIGANTATFSVVNMLLLRPLPVADPHRLVELGRDTSSGPGNFSYALYERVRDQNSTFSGVAAVSSPVIRADQNSSDQPLVGRYVSGNFFETLGIGPAAGRLLAPDDDRIASSSGAAVAVISHGLWQRMFAGDLSALGRTLAIGGSATRPAVRFTIVGVLPRDFSGLIVGRSDDFYVPLASEAAVSSRSLLRMPSAGWLKVIARVKPGISRDTPRADVGVIYARFIEDAAPYSSEAVTRGRRADRITVESARAGLSGPRRDFGRPVLLLMGAVALVLVVACANVVNLLLARGLTRRGEVAVRLAMGASRGRLVRQMLVESAVFGLIGGAFGLSLAAWGTPRIAALMANEDPTVVYDVAPDGLVLTFTVVLSLGSALAGGLLPALRTSRASAPSLRQDAGARGAKTGPSVWMRGLVAFQVALSLLLLAGALLLVTTLRNFRTGEFGFDRDGVVFMRLEAGRAGYTGERGLTYYRAVLDRARSGNGVRGAALSLGMPVIGAGVNTSFGVEGQPRDPEAQVFVNDVTDGYFEVTGTKLLLGRDFGPQDSAHSTPVAIINDTLARRYFGARNPIGQRVNVGVRGPQSHASDMEIVGVVETTKYQSLRESDSPIVYLHALQSLSTGGLASSTALNLVVKATGEPASAGEAVRRAVEEVAPVRVSPAVTLSSAIDRTLVEERLIARVLGAFALLAVALSAAGLYGVLAYITARRTAEIGIRLALGATRGAVLRRVLGEAATLAALGIAIGVPSALALTGFLSSLLYGVTPGDPRLLGAVVVCLFGAALIAGSVPAWRASRIDPLEALRSE